MATIQVTPELLREKATSVRSLKTNHDQNMSKLGTLITGLNEIWKGEAVQKYIEEYQSMQSTFTNFSNMLENYAGALDTAANDFEGKDHEIAGKMTGFGQR